MWRLASALAFLLLAGPAFAERPVLSGALGAWLEQSAAPELVEQLARHPKFKGAQIRFVTLQDGKPAGRENELSVAIQRQLIHRILRAGSNDVAWNQGPRGCGGVPSEHYVLGIEFTRLSRYRHRLDLAVLDPRENVWVSGFSYTWQGRLLPSEVTALRRDVQRGAPGSVQNPIHIGNREQLVAAVDEQMKCTLRGGLDGTVFIASDSAREVQVFVGELQRTLTVRPNVLVAPDEESASWVARVGVSPVRDAVHELTLELAPRDDDTQVQRIVSVYVSGIVSGSAGNASGNASDNASGKERRVVRTERAPVTPRAPARDRRPVVPVEPAALTTSLRLASRAPDHHCGARRTQTCAEVVLDLSQQAHVLVFGTNQARVSLPSCGSEQREAGEYRYRVKLTRDAGPSARPDAGLFVVASRRGSVMREITSEVKKLAPRCAKRPASPGQLRALLDVLDKYAEDIRWEAIHLRLEGGRVETI